MDDLRRQLNEALGGLEPSPVPLDRITRRGRRTRRRRAGAAAVTLAAVASVAVVVASPTTHPLTPAGPSSPVTANAQPIISFGNVTRPFGAAASNVFVQGTVNGQAWRLQVVNAADDGHSCLPGVTLNNQDVDVLSPRPDTALTPVGAPSVFTSGQGFSYVFIQVPADVTQIGFGSVRVPLALVPLTECGRTFRLTGFAFPDKATVTLTAVTQSGVSRSYVLPRALYAAKSGWQNLDVSSGEGVTRTLAHDGDMTLTASVGGYGECYSTSWQIGKVATNQPICLPITITPPDFRVVSIPGLTLDNVTTYAVALAVGSSVHSVVARLANGKTVRATPVDVDGRLEIGFLTTSPVTSVTRYNAAGENLGSMHAPTVNSA